MRTLIGRFLWVAWAFAWTAQAHAHSASTSYLKFDAAAGSEIGFEWRIALRDVDALLDLDADGDGRLTWGEVIDRSADIVQLAQRSLGVFSSDGECPLALDPLRTQSLGGTGYLLLSGRARCERPSARVEVAYRLFAGIDPSHRSLVTVPGLVRPVLLAPGGTLALGGDAVEAEHGFAVMLANGVLHILTGFDHMLFLVALILPAVLQRRPGGWVAREDLRSALAHVAWIATAFTLAHSISLALASFHVVRLPVRVIEPLIAGTVLATALNNLWPVLTQRLAFAAFGFGLIHGFGFAEVLAPLNLPAAELARGLLAFNLGVEGGQLLVIGPSFALLTALRAWRGYPRWVLGGGSGILALVAGAWIVERVFDVSVL